MGYNVQIETVHSKENQLFDTTIAALFTEKIAEAKYFHRSLNTQATITPNRWQLLHQWQGPEESTLLLTLLNHPAPQHDSKPALTINTHAALYACTSSDLTKFNKSTPATRQKATDWLRTRAELISATTLDTRRGSRTFHENAVFWIYDNGGLTSSQLGFEIEATCQQYSPIEQKFDATFLAAWSEPNKPKSKPDYTFAINQTFTPGQTSLHHPISKPANAEKELILLLTPTISHPSKPDNIPSPTPHKTEPYIAQYRVPVDFYRTLLEKLPTPGNPAGDPFAKKSGIPNPQPIKDLLEQIGLKFPQGTIVTLNKSTSTLTFRHTQKAHATLKAYLESLK